MLQLEKPTTKPFEDLRDDMRKNEERERGNKCFVSQPRAGEGAKRHTGPFLKESFLMKLRGKGELIRLRHIL